MANITNEIAINIAIEAINKVGEDNLETYGFEMWAIIDKLNSIVTAQKNRTAREKTKRQEKAQANKTDKINTIISVLQDTGRPMTCGEIAEAMEIAFQSITKVLNEMVENGTIDVTEIKATKGKRKAYFINTEVEGEVEDTEVE